MHLARKILTALGLFFVAIGLILGFAENIRYIPVVREAIVLATTVKPEGFTELYFENHLSLPNKIINDKVNEFKFTLHNLENIDMEYPFDVTVDADGEKEVITESSVFVKKDAYVTISQNFKIANGVTSARVVVYLIRKNQQIDFWMEK